MTQGAATGTLTLYGFGPSVYTRVIRLVLAEKSLGYDYVDCNPFAEDGAPAALPHPFGRVPVLVHGGFTVYESAAIARYLEAAFPAPALLPAHPQALARVAQVTAIVDAYGYWPMVRQVFAQRVFRPLEGLAPEASEIARGLEASRPVLAALEAIAVEGRVLTGSEPTLADCHLAPMIGAFASAPEGRAALEGAPALSAWWRVWRERPSMQATDPGFGAPPALGA